MVYSQIGSQNYYSVMFFKLRQKMNTALGLSLWACVQLSLLRLFATLSPMVAAQAALSISTLQTRIPEWVAISSSRDLPNPGMEAVVSFTGRWILYS